MEPLDLDGPRPTRSPAAGARAGRRPMTERLSVTVTDRSLALAVVDTANGRCYRLHMTASSVARRTRSDVTVAVAYLRASTDDQHLSPDAQRAAVETWARAAGVSVVSWHVDAGVSGAADLGDRPALGAALVALRHHRAGLLVVAKRDRLARDCYVAGAIDRAAAAAGARVVSADGTGNGDTPADGFMRSVLDAAAAYERALIRSRTKAALAVKKARGERTGTVRYGFTADAAGRLVECPAELAVIAQVRALRDAGLSHRAIVAELARIGVIGRTGRALGLSQVQNILAGAA